MTVDDLPPDEDAAALIERLAAEVAGADGAPPLSDHALTRLRSGGAVHLSVHDGSTLRAYGQLDGRSLELVGAPDAAAEVLAAAERRSDDPLLVWSHGRASRLVALLAERGYERVRELFQLRRPADAPLPADPPLADGIAVRRFVPGADEDAWVVVNSAAFATHPEQGRVTRADLEALEAEPWFDPAGFLLAERDGELLGFHWTKIHPDGAGEVYVLGIAPSAQGLGLGGALLVRGLRHLHEQGCPYVLLYVDGDNTGAVHLYERDLFTRHDVDIQWQGPENRT